MKPAPLFSLHFISLLLLSASSRIAHSSQFFPCISKWHTEDNVGVSVLEIACCFLFASAVFDKKAFSSPQPSHWMGYNSVEARVRALRVVRPRLPSATVSITVGQTGSGKRFKVASLSLASINRFPEPVLPTLVRIDRNYHNSKLICKAFVLLNLSISRTITLKSTINWMRCVGSTSKSGRSS